MSISFFSTWLVGALNGYKLKEDGLPNSIKYGTMVLASGVNIFKASAKINPPIISPGFTMFGLCIWVPVFVGTTFCLGNYVGKAIRYTEDGKK